nr:thioredoxin domain-containing protein [Pseudomonas chlororaphis]
MRVITAKRIWDAKEKWPHSAKALDVWADWCGPCKSFAPVFEQAAVQLAGKCRLAKLDSEANQQLSAQLGIRSIPSLILFKNGREVARQSGAFPLPQLMSWLRSQGI